MVANDVIGFIASAISAVSGWFIDIFTATDMIPFYLVMTFVGLVVSLLLAPVLPADRGSDKATSKRKDDE